MTHSRRDFLKLTGIGVSGLALSACGDDSDGNNAGLVDNPNSTLDVATARTRVAPMLIDVPGGPGFDVKPLVSAGDEIPLLSGTFPKLTPSASLTYGLAGDPDGMGFAEIDGYYWVWLQHEVVGDSSDSDYRSTIFSRTISGSVPGARISLLKFTKDWQLIGGMPLIREYKPTTILMQDDGETPRVAAGSKITIDTSAKTYLQEGYVSSDFCGGMLAESGFVNPLSGFVEPVWFANEENGGYSGVAWACFPDGVAYPLEGFGIFEKETTVSLRRHRPKDVGHNILVASEDNDDGRIYLWIGVPTATDPNGFVNGQMYAMKIAGAARESGPGRFDGVPAGD
ncbi:MAG: twin-arginine translocation signal domain-containing protein, partial [Solimonas sp.]